MRSRKALDDDEHHAQHAQKKSMLPLFPPLALLPEAVHFREGGLPEGVFPAPPIPLHAGKAPSKAVVGPAERVIGIDAGKAAEGSPARRRSPSSSRILSRSPPGSSAFSSRSSSSTLTRTSSVADQSKPTRRPFPSSSAPAARGLGADKSRRGFLCRGVCSPDFP